MELLITFLKDQNMMTNLNPRRNRITNEEAIALIN